MASSFAALLGKIVGAALLKRVSERAFRTIGLGVVILAGHPGWCLGGAWAVTALWALFSGRLSRQQSPLRT